MKTMVDRKKLLIIFALLTFLFAVFNVVFESRGKYISPDDYHASNSSGWVRLNYQVNLADLHGKKIDELKAAYTALSSENYFEIHNQFVYIPFFEGKEIFLYGYEEGHADDSIYQHEDIVFSGVKTVQLSHNALSRFNISLWRGEFFPDANYQDGDMVPILLGYEYKGVFDIGDELEADFIEKLLKFKVIGILNKDSHIMMQGYPLYLDRYIVMPSINCLYSPATPEEDLFQVRHYVNKLEGWYEYNNSSQLKVLKNKISAINETLPGRITLLSLERPTMIDSIFSSMIILEQAASWVSILLAILLSVLCPLIYFRLQLKNLSLLCTNVLLGINYKNILIKNILLFLSILALSNLSVLAILIMIGITFTKWILVIDTLAVTTLILLNFLFLKESNLISYMGGLHLAANTKHF